MTRAFNTFMGLMGLAILAGSIAFFVKDMGLRDRTIASAYESIDDYHDSQRTNVWRQSKNEETRDNINAALLMPDLSTGELTYLRYYRAKVINIILAVDQLHGRIIDLQQAEIALQDLDYVLSNDEDRTYQNAGYNAGVIAFNFLNDEPRAGEILETLCTRRPRRLHECGG